jgi:hypothetical protein
VPDEPIDGPRPANDATPAPAPPPVSTPAAPAIAAAHAAGAGSRPPRRPSWLRAAVVSLVILAAGVALGAAGYHLERTYSVQPPAIERTHAGWIITGQHGHELSGLALNGPRLIWQDGAGIEYVRLGEGAVRLLGPGPGMHATWDPAIGERYALWFEAERQGSLAVEAVAYDTQTGRRWSVADAGSVRSYPAISGDVAVWCSARQIGVPSINGVRVGSGESFEVAPGDGAPMVAGGLAVWATSWAGPFLASEIGSGTTWPVPGGASRGRITGIALAGRTLVWGQGSEPGTGVVAAADVDGGGTTTLATGLSGLAGPAYDGRTVVWAEKTATGARVMGRRLGGAAFLIARVGGDVKEVAVSGDTIAWIGSTAGAYSIVTAGLPQ